MNVTKMTIAAAVLWLILHFVLIPAVRRAEARAEAIARALPLTMMLAALKTVRTFAACSTVVFGTTALLAWQLGRSSGLSLDQLHAAAVRVASAKQVVDSAAAAWGLVTMALTSVALVLLARRGAEREQSRQIARVLTTEVARLAELDRECKLPYLPPTEEMKAGLALFAELGEEHARLAGDGVDSSLIEYNMDAVQRQLTTLDLLRRVREADVLASARRLETTPLDRVTDAFSTKGMFTNLTRLGKGISFGAMGLLLLSLVDVAGAAVQGSLQQHATSLDDLIVELTAKEIDARFRLSLGPAAPRTLTDEDRKVARYLANRLERAATQANFWRRGSDAGEPGTRSHQARRQILYVAARRAPELLSVRDSTSERTSEFAKKYGAILSPPVEPAPTSSLGTRMEADLVEIADSHPAVWDHLRSRFRKEALAFNAPVELGDIAGTLLGESLGQAMSGVAGSGEGLVGKLSRDVVKAVGKAGLDRWYRRNLQTFVVELSRGGTIEAAAAAVVADAPQAPIFSAREILRLQEMLPDTPKNGSIAGDLLSPSIVAIADTRVPPQVLTWGKNAPLSNLVKSAALESYDDLFPPIGDYTKETLRGKLMGARKVEVAADPIALKRSRDYGLLDTFNRVGGVVFGKGPTDTGPLDIRALEWQPGPKGSALVLYDVERRPVRVAVHDPSLLHFAAVYAADDRKTVVTIMNAGDVSSQKVHLHPAFVDTVFGCRAIQLDNLVFDLIEDTNRWRKADRDVDQDRVLYAVAAFSALKAVARNDRDDPPNPDLVLGFLAGTRFDADASVALLEQPNSNSSPVSQTPNIYAGDVAVAMGACTVTARSLPEFKSCVAADSAAREWGEFIWNTSLPRVRESCEYPSPLLEQCLAEVLDRWVLFPELSVVSGVRELPYSLHDLMDEGESPALSPLKFLVQAVFRPKQSADESDAAWRFPGLGSFPEESVATEAARNPSVRSIVDQFREFVRLQRLFRAALDGGLGDAFPLDDLVRLANATAEDVRKHPTPRWMSVRTGNFARDVDSALAAALGVHGPGPKVRIVCEGS